MDLGVRVRVTLIRVRIGTRVSVMVSVKFGIRAKDGRDAELKSYVLCYQVLTHLLDASGSCNIRKCHPRMLWSS